MPKVRSNLVVGKNGMTTKAGSSKGLSSREDRRKFHELRGLSEVILIGGSTYQSEPYAKCPLPIYVSTRSPSPKIDEVHFYKLSPVQLIERAIADGFREILIEGGVEFLRELISNSLIDEIHITRSNQEGDSDKFDEGDLLSKYQLSSNVFENETSFEVWEPLIQQR